MLIRFTRGRRVTQGRVPTEMDFYLRTRHGKAKLILKGFRINNFQEDLNLGELYGKSRDREIQKIVFGDLK